MAGELLFRQPVPTENALRPEGQQLHFTHSPLEMKLERNRQLICRKPPLPFRCVITTTVAMSKIPDLRHEEATGRELIAVLRQLPEVGRFLAKRRGRPSPVVSLFHKAKKGAIANAQAGTKRSLSLWQR
jgi:hypothetical protein